MTEEEIIKALECCGDKICKHCPKYNSEDIECSEKLIKYTLDFIKRQQTEKEALIAGHETLQKALAEKNAEIERLTKRAEQYPCVVNVGNNCFVYAKSLDDYDNFIGDVSAEAYKEFAERLKDKSMFLEDDERYVGDVVKMKDVDNLVKELTEVSND